MVELDADLRREGVEEPLLLTDADVNVLAERVAALVTLAVIVEEGVTDAMDDALLEAVELCAEEEETVALGERLSDNEFVLDAEKTVETLPDTLALALMEVDGVFVVDSDDEAVELIEADVDLEMDALADGDRVGLVVALTDVLRLGEREGRGQTVLVGDLEIVVLPDVVELTDRDWLGERVNDGLEVALKAALADTVAEALRVTTPEEETVRVVMPVMDIEFVGVDVRVAKTVVPCHELVGDSDTVALRLASTDRDGEPQDERD